MIFISYAKTHARNCYHMYNLTTGYVTETRDIKWLHHMYHCKPEARDEVVVYLQVAYPFKFEDAEKKEGVMSNASESKIESKDDKKEWSTVHRRSGSVVKPMVLYMKEYGSNKVEGGKMIKK